MSSKKYLAIWFPEDTSLPFFGRMFELLVIVVDDLKVWQFLSWWIQPTIETYKIIHKNNPIFQILTQTPSASLSAKYPGRSLLT